MIRLGMIIMMMVAGLQAEYLRQPITKELVAGPMKIIDIRTPTEWRTTGLVKGAIPITFFDEQGQYDANKFVAALQKHIKPNERFAIMCNSGNRSRTVGTFLSQKMGYRVLDLEGGIQSAIRQNIPREAYRD